MANGGVKEMERILSGAQLPALPQSAIRLLELAKNPDNGPAEFAVPIEADPGLAGQVLRFVNSSYFGFSREISSVKLAINMVGVRTIKNFSLWSAVFSLMPNPKCGMFDLKSLWQDSIRRALFARHFGKAMGQKDSEDLFAAALLQDMAVPLLVKEMPDTYGTLLQNRNGGSERLSNLETERLGWTHAQAAAFMCRRWNLPETFAGLIEQHTSANSLLDGRAKAVGPISVALSSMLPVNGDNSWHEGAHFEELALKAVPGLNLPDVLGKVDQELAEFAPLLKVPMPAKSLVNWHESLQEEAVKS